MEQQKVAKEALPHLGQDSDQAVTDFSKATPNQDQAVVEANQAFATQTPAKEQGSLLAEEKSANGNEPVADNAEGKQALKEANKGNKKSVGKKLAEYFTATRIAYMAVFTALAYVLYLFDFSLLPGTPVSFLKLDFSNVFVMIAGFALGPVSGVIVGVLKEVLHAITVGNTAFVGEAANMLFILSYTLLPAIIYKKHKGIKVVLISLLAACLVQCVCSVPINYLLTFPAFYVAYGGSWQAGQDLFVSVWYWAVLFNFVKTVIVSVAVMILYKPLSRLIKLTNAKFVAVKQKRKQAK